MAAQAQGLSLAATPPPSSASSSSPPGEGGSSASPAVALAAAKGAVLAVIPTRANVVAGLAAFPVCS